MSLFDQKCFWDESAAARAIEAVRWPQGAECPACGEVRRVRPIAGRTTVSGSFKCYACSRRFSVRNGCVLEGSHIPLSRWLRAILLVACATKPVGCKHLEEACGVAPRIARILRHKIVLRLEAPCDAATLDDAQTAFHAVLAAAPSPGPDDRAFDDVGRALGIPDSDGEMAFLKAVFQVVSVNERRQGSSGSNMGTDPDLLAARPLSNPLHGPEMPFYGD